MQALRKLVLFKRYSDTDICCRFCEIFVDACELLFLHRRVYTKQGIDIESLTVNKFQLGLNFQTLSHKDLTAETDPKLSEISMMERFVTIVK